MLEPAQEKRIRESIGRQSLLTTFGVEVAELDAGRVVLELPFGDHMLQQDGFVHAGAITTVADSACGYAAMTLQPEDRNILTVEMKINLLSPAVGERFLATATVARAGRTITVCSAEVVACTGEDRKPVALMQATLMAVPA